MSRVAQAKGATVVALHRVASLLSTRRASEKCDLRRQTRIVSRAAVLHTVIAWTKRFSDTPVHPTMKLVKEYKYPDGFPRNLCPPVQDWGQVCRLEAQKLWRFRGIYQE